MDRRADDVSAAGTAPAGTVTFVFTDIEGSTALLDELGQERYAALLAEHHRVCREAWSAQGGFEVDTAGDSFVVAFPTASGALAATAAAQESLLALGLRVRMGVHTGEVLVAETGYVGIEVHRAARIAAAAHGGQVVFSAATAALVDVPLHDLGEHRFKDLRAPERVFQLGDGVFPPLRSLHQSNLPVPATPFLGRAAELDHVRRLVTRVGVRQLTLTGPGGTGKTRLALQAAADASDDFPGGTFWLPLAPLRNAELILAGIAQALELDEPADEELRAAVVRRLSVRRTLLLLDNAEHLLPGAAGVVADLIAACESLTVLVTSRERLQLRAEQVYPVPALGEGDANDLFVARARQLDPAFQASAAVPELCRLLDALPLALELAAARTALFTPEQLLARIGGRLDLLRGPGDADPRQQTLRATIDWSHDLLDEPERRLFRRLSVFPAGCTYEEAEEVSGADPDTLQSLIDKSLLRRRDDQSQPRYWQLETIREYGEEQLERMGEHEQTWGRLVDAYVKFARAAEPGWYRGGAGQWADRFVSELPNIRAALQWSLIHRPADALAITAYLGYCWQLAGLMPESLDWIERAQQRADILDPDLAAYTMMVVGIARHETGHPGAEQVLRASLPLLLERGWLHYHAFILTHIAPYEAARDPVAAEAMLQLAEREALEMESDNAAVLGAALSGLAELAEARGDVEEALALLERSGELRFAHPAHQIVHLLDVARLLLGVPDLDRAEPWLREAEALADANPPFVTRERAWIDISFAAAALLRGDAEEAERRINSAADAGEATGRAPIIGHALLLQAGLHALRNDKAAAVETHRRAIELLPQSTPSGSFRSVLRLLLDPLAGIAPSGDRGDRSPPPR